MSETKERTYDESLLTEARHVRSEWTQEAREDYAKSMQQIAEGIRSGRVENVYCVCEDADDVFEVMAGSQNFRVGITLHLLKKCDSEERAFVLARAIMDVPIGSE